MPEGGAGREAPIIPSLASKGTPHAQEMIYGARLGKRLGASFKPSSGFLSSGKVASFHSEKGSRSSI